MGRPSRLRPVYAEFSRAFFGGFYILQRFYVVRNGLSLQLYALGEIGPGRGAAEAA